MGRVCKIVQMGLGERVFRMRADGFSLNRIAKVLQEEGYRVTVLNVRNFLHRYGDTIKEVLKPEQVAEYYVDAGKQLMQLNQALWSQANVALRNGDTAMFLKTAKALHENLGLWLRQQGEISNGAEININIQMFAEQVQALVSFIYERHPELRRDFLEYVRSLKNSSERGLKNAQQQ